jgi:hypothetical protein
MSRKKILDKNTDVSPEAKITNEIFLGRSDAKIFALMLKYPHLAKQHLTKIGLLTKSGNIAKPYQTLFK